MPKKRQNEVEEANIFQNDPLKQVAESLKLKGGLASAILDTIGALVVVLDKKGRIVYFNHACEKTTGYTLEDVQGRFVFDIFILPEEANGVKNVFRKLKAGQLPSSYENCWRTKDGQKRLISWTNTVILGPDGEVQWVVPTGIDITDRRQAEDERLQLLERVRLILESVDEGLYAVDEEGHCTMFNKAANSITGYTAEEVLGKNIHKLIHHSHGDGSKYQRGGCPVAKAIKEGRGLRLDSETLWRKDGSPFIAEHASYPIIENGEIKGAVITFIDITERKKSEELLNYLAYYDALTELPNRTLLNDRLNQALAHAKRNKNMLALLFIDLDNFKTINDSLGHSVGDVLLKSVSERIKKCLREGDTVARLGGDEFILLLPQINDIDNVNTVAEKVLDSLKPPFYQDGREFYITTSIGISLYPQDGKDATTLLKNADVALYRAKERGRDTYQFYASAMNAEALTRLTIESSMRKALEREEFEIYYQPQVDIRSNQIIGLEALLRWQHPELGLITPQDFIPIAEETGLILPIGEWVLKAACEQNKRWQDAGYPPIPVSINLSARQFKQPDLVGVINRILKETGLSPTCLELEITESAVMHDEKMAAATLRKLKRSGIKVAIDDFGTGYSSLGYLKRFPLDRLKIDRLFIHSLTQDANDAAITKAIIAMAHGLNLKALAEGVETVEQLELLRSLKCDEMQGFLFSRPLNVKEVAKLFTKKPRLSA